MHDEKIAMMFYNHVHPSILKIKVQTIWRYNNPASTFVDTGLLVVAVLGFVDFDLVYDLV